MLLLQTGYHLIKSKLKDRVFSSFRGSQKSSEKNLSKAELKSLKDLINNKDIIIQKADKGNTVVVLNKIDYINKMNNFLQNSNKFEKIENEVDKELNYIINTENKFKTVFKNLYVQGQLTKNEYERI